MKPDTIQANPNCEHCHGSAVCHVVIEAEDCLARCPCSVNYPVKRPPGAIKRGYGNRVHGPSANFHILQLAGSSVQIVCPLFRNIPIVFLTEGKNWVCRFCGREECDIQPCYQSQGVL